MKHFIGILIIVLVVLHQDNWLWYDSRLVAGFMPITLLYHACISIAAGVTWYLATKYCWQADVDFITDGDQQGGGQQGGDQQGGGQQGGGQG